MADERPGRRAPTRRDYVKYGGAVGGGGLLAGCAGQSGSGSTPESDGSDTASTNGTGTEPEDATGTGASRTATMPPVGELEFDAAPESLFDSEGSVADIINGDI